MKPNHVPLLFHLQVPLLFVMYCWRGSAVTWSHRTLSSRVSFRQVRELCVCRAAETTVVVVRLECMDDMDSAVLGAE